MSLQKRNTLNMFMKKNHLIIPLLQEEKNKLINIISEAEKRVSKAPEGGVQVKKYKKGVQFYYRETSKLKCGKYMCSSEKEKAIALIQKRYDEKVVSSAKRQLKIINRFLGKYEPDCLENVLLSESVIRRQFINPFEVPDAAFIENWQGEKYNPKPFYEGSKVHLTNKEEKVRSKSEVLIANALCRYGIPYRYEYPFNIGDRTIYPDFMVLRISDREELYWEHLGMMDDSEYRNNAFRKIKDYEENGIFPGERLILTVETYKMPLTQQTIDRMIQHFIQ